MGAVWSGPRPQVVRLASRALRVATPQAATPQAATLLRAARRTGDRSAGSVGRSSVPAESDARWSACRRRHAAATVPSSHCQRSPLRARSPPATAGPPTVRRRQHRHPCQRRRHRWRTRHEGGTPRRRGRLAAGPPALLRRAAVCAWRAAPRGPCSLGCRLSPRPRVDRKTWGCGHQSAKRASRRPLRRTVPVAHRSRAVVLPAGFRPFNASYGYLTLLTCRWGRILLARVVLS